MDTIKVLEEVGREIASKSEFIRQMECARKRGLRKISNYQKDYVPPHCKSLQSMDITANYSISLCSKELYIKSLKCATCAYTCGIYTSRFQFDLKISKS